MPRIIQQDQICAKEIAKLFEKMDERTKAYIMGYSQGISEKEKITSIMCNKLSDSNETKK